MSQAALLHVLLQYGHSPITEESQLNGCYLSHIIIHSGTHIVKVPDHVKDKIASPVNCALATMVNVTSGLDGKNPCRNTVAVIQVDLAVVTNSFRNTRYLDFLWTISWVSNNLRPNHWNKAQFLNS